MSEYHWQPKTALLHITILLAVSLPYCINLGKSSVWDANEAFYAETPREMLVTGDYLAPRFNFQPRTQKPPFTYWVVLVSYKLFGINEFAVRLPGSLAAIAAILFSYGIARMLFGMRAALISAIITATTARLFILARRLPIDILLLFFLTGALFFLVRAIQSKKIANWVLFYLCVSLGFLTKGPVALVIPVGAYLGWILWRRQLKTASLHPLMGAAVFALVALPWYVLVYRAHGWTYISPFFLRDNLRRFAVESMGPSRGSFYYLSVFITDFFPWSLLAIVSVYLLWVGRKAQPLKSLSFGLPLIWCAFTFLLFSLSKNKQEYYIAPIYPAAAVIISGVLDRAMRYGDSKALPSESNRDDPLPPSKIAPEPICFHQSSWWDWCYGLLAFLLASLSMLMPFVFRSFMPGIPLVLHYAPSLVLIGGAVLLAMSIIRGKLAHCFPALAIPLWSIFLMGALFYLPALEPYRPVKEFCRLIAAQSFGDAEAGFFRTALPSMVFYLRRPVFEESSYEEMTDRFQSNRRVFCVLSQKDYAYFADRNLTLHILDRSSRFALRLKALFNAGYFPEEELLLVSNRPNTETKSSGSRPVL